MFDKSTPVCLWVYVPTPYVLYDCAKIAYTNLGTKEKTLHVAYFSYFLPVAVCNYLFTEALHKGLIGLSGAR